MPHIQNLQQFVQKYRWFIAGAVVIVVLIATGIYYALQAARPAPPDTTTFQSGNFSFTYPRVYTAKEYADGSVALGGMSGDVFIPLVDVVRYKSDPDRAAPASFDTFAARQAENLCGSDAQGVSIACTNPVGEAYTSPTGLVGTKMSLSLVRKNLASGTTTTSAFAPVYIFNTTVPADPGEAVRYQGVFVYPDFSSFVLAPDSASLVSDVASTVRVSKGAHMVGSTTPQ